MDINDTQTEIILDDDSELCRACKNDSQEYHPFVTCTRCSDR